MVSVVPGRLIASVDKFTLVMTPPETKKLLLEISDASNTTAPYGEDVTVTEDADEVALSVRPNIFPTTVSVPLENE